MVSHSGWRASHRIVVLLRLFAIAGASRSPYKDNSTSLVDSTGATSFGPPCHVEYSIDDFVARAGAWCNPNLVSPERRVPHKLQGLYWVRGGLSDAVAVCFSTGVWDQSKKMLKLTVWKDFLFRNRLVAFDRVISGTSTALVAYNANWEIEVRFKDEALTQASWTWIAAGSILNPINIPAKIASLGFNMFTKHELVQDGSEEPGKRWSRPSWVGMWPIQVSVGEFNLWRVMDGGLTIDQAWSDFMTVHVKDAEHDGFVRYFDKVESILGLSLPFPCPTEPKLEPAVTCDDGVFVAATRQPKFGLRHFKPTQGEYITFAKTSLGEDDDGGECTLEYKISCTMENEVHILEDKQCNHEVNSVLIHSLSGRSGALRTTWQVCARPLFFHSALDLTNELVDLTWDVALGAEGESTPMTGCIELWRADKVPELEAVRGDFEAQKDALIRKKAAVGGCPTFTSADDRKSRGSDFMQRQSLDLMGISDAGSSIESLGPWMLALQVAHDLKASLWSKKIARWSTTKTWEGTLVGLTSDVATFGLMLGFYGISMNMNSTTAAMAFAEVNCGAPAPFLDGPQKFRYAEVAEMAALQTQRRSFATATVPQVETCFDPTGPLFQSTGSGPHRDYRTAFEYIFSGGFVEPVYEQDSRPHTWRPEDKPPSMGQIGSLVLPVLLESVWGKKPLDHTMAAILPYLDKGRMCKLGSVGETMASATFSKSEITAARDTMRVFAASSPVGEHVKEMLDRELPDLKSALEKHLPGKHRNFTNQRQYVPERYESVGDMLIQDLSDVVLFKGMLDTSDMVHKCVTYQWRDHEHRRLFLKDSEAYLHELMRYDGSATSFNAALEETTIMTMEGKEIEFPEGVGIQYVLATANRDPAKFSDPHLFEPTREDLKEQLAWGGRLEDVMRKSHEGAPRHCPAYKLSMSIATAVCTHLTRELDAYDGERGTEQRSGRVVVVKPGDKFHGTVGFVVHRRGEAFEAIEGPVDAARRLAAGVAVLGGRWCVRSGVDNKFMGCYRETELKMDGETLQSMMDSTTDIQSEAKTCPSWLPSWLDAFARWASEESLSSEEHLELFMDFGFSTVFGDEIVGKLNRSWANTYTIGMYASITSMIEKYRPRTVGDVPVPMHMGVTQQLQVGQLTSPKVDIDFPTFLPEEAWVPKFLYRIVGSNSLYFPTFNCLQVALRNHDLVESDYTYTKETMLVVSTVGDDLFAKDQNVWEPLLQEGEDTIHPRKKDFIKAMFKVGETGSVWPETANDLSYRFLKEGKWEDTLEHAMAFKHIGTHRVRPYTGNITGQDGLDLKYKLDVGMPPGTAHEHELREGFGRPQSTMYFDNEGMPKAVMMSHGGVVRPGDEAWQEAKFVWRSTLLFSVTMEDHMLFTHFHVANGVAVAARDALPPNHPLRRMLSIFTFGTIFSNLNYLHTLMGDNALLHRASPFRNFDDATKSFSGSAGSIMNEHEIFFDEQKFAELGDVLKESPYYEDGKLLFDELRWFVDGWMSIFERKFCHKASRKLNQGDDIYKFAARLTTELNLGKSDASSMTCEEFSRILTCVLWTVTGFHRHVSDIADFLLDPDVASFSWKEGEAFPRPRQHILAALTVPLINTKQPKLLAKGDKGQGYEYVFDNIEHDDQAKGLWADFVTRLEHVSESIHEANQNRASRGQLVYRSADPKEVEISVAA